MLWSITIVVILVLLVIGYTFVDPVFGGKPNAESLKKIEASKNYNGAIFINKEKTDVMVFSKDAKAWPNTQKGMFSQLNPPKDKNPQNLLPTVKFEKENLKVGSFAWLGHSTLLMNVDGTKIIIDPVFYKASPIFIGGKPFKFKHPTTIKDLPKLDVVLISHDHYDHLDTKAIKEMDPLVKQYLVPLGIKAHLLKWGVEDHKIREFDWYESAQLGSVDFIFTPTRHFSGRGLFNRFSTLWGSWVIKGRTQNIYASGDSGYTEEFAAIGKKYGPFDIVFLESGAYNSDWSQIHMFPEQSVQAGIDLQAEVLFPIHWGKFDLSLHYWKEPIERFTQFAQQKQKNVATPMIGEVFTLQEVPQKKWW